jgi:hypothetical protein
MMTDRKLMIENAIENINRTATERQVEAGRLYLGALQGDQKAKHALIEGISTSDIPSLLAPAINVQFLANYAAMPVVWNQIAEQVIDAPRFGTVEFGGFDFDVENLKGMHDGDQYVGAGLPGVGEYGEYPALGFTTEQLDVDLRKNGVRLRISWEAIMNSGNVDIIGRATEAFARYAAEQEDIALAKQFVSTAGVVNASFTEANDGTDPNPALTLESLEKVIAQASRINVGTGRHVNARSYRLVTTGALSQTARRILSTTEVRRTDGTDVLIQSPALGNVAHTEFWALDAVGSATTAGAMDDYWFIVPQGTARAAFAEVFLAGYRTPLITIKDSGQFSLSGGAVPSREGSFESDDIEVRGRHVVGAAAIAPQIVVASDGTGA